MDGKMNEEEERRLAHLQKFEDEVESDSDDHADDYDWCTAIRSSSGLETALSIAYPGAPGFQLSTCLDETQIAPMFDGTQWAGTRIWPAAVECLEYILDHVEVTEKTKVLELGCGLGLPGMLLQLLKECSVVISDKIDLVPQMEQNLKHEAFTGRAIEAHALDWSEAGVDEFMSRLPSEGFPSFDIVFNCDCVYVPLYGDSFKALVAVQLAFLSRNPSTVLITSVERRRVDGVGDYLEALKSSCLVDDVEQVLSKGKIEIYKVYGKT